MTIDNHDGQILTEIHGRRLGLDHRGFLTGVPDVRAGSETLTAASTMAAGGTSVLAAAAAAVFELVPPSVDLVGVRKRIFSGTTDAVAMYAKLTAGALVVDGSTFAVAVLTTRGTFVDLEYISTGEIAVLGKTSTSLVTFAATT